MPCRVRFLAPGMRKKCPKNSFEAMAVHESLPPLRHALTFGRAFKECPHAFCYRLVRDPPQDTERSSRSFLKKRLIRFIMGCVDRNQKRRRSCCREFILGET